MKKKKVFIFIGILIIWVSVIYLIYINKNEKIDNSIKSFHYGYGSFDGYWDYNIVKENDGMVNLSAKGKNGVDLKIDKKVSDDILKDIERLIEENEIDNWNGFSEVDHDVLDGYSFELQVEYEDGRKLLATGYTKFPENYEQGHKALAEYLEEIH